MAILLKGPITDTYPPLVGQLHKWVFKNVTGEDIYSLNISTGPDKNAPGIRRILLTIDSESSLHDTFSDPDSYSLMISNLFQAREFIKHNQEFELELAFSNVFSPDNFIQFSPANKKGANIVKHLQTNYVESTVNTIPDVSVNKIERGNTYSQSIEDEYNCLIKILEENKDCCADDLEEEEE